jgi:uncharacterized repeat protein (TIGR01451 family)
MKIGFRSASALFAAFLALAALASAARAQIIEFEDAEIFRPTTDGGDFISVYDSDALPRNKFHLGVYGDYARNPLEIQFVRSGNTFSRLVHDLGTLQFSGAYGVFKNVDVGVRIPAYITGVKDLALGDDNAPGGTHANIGDVVANVKFTLLPRRLYGFGIAVLPEITLPTGNRREFAGTGKLGYGGLAIADWAPNDKFSMAINFGGLVRDEAGGGPFVKSNDAFNDQLRWGAAAAYDLNERWTAIAEAYGAANTTSPFRVERKTPLDAIGGFRWHLGPVDLTFGGGAGLTSGQGSPDFRLFVGVTTPKPPYAEEGVGPNLAAESSKAYNVVDRDGDGRTSPGDLLEYRINLVNSGDRAATQVKVVDPIPEHTKYVPGTLTIDARPMSDVVDDDQAEIDPGPPERAVFRLPILEAAPGKKEAIFTFQVEIDRNLTEITTIVNQAVGSAAELPEFPIPAASTTVFPAIAEHEHVIVGPEKLELTEEIHFEFDKAVIRRESWPILQELGDVLKQYPDLRVRIEGHTDSVGSESYNQRLSERRALAVRDFLVGLGIDSSRLEWAGYGESRPIATNDTSEGRAMNRRTEFPVLNPEALKNRVIQQERYREDISPQSEPEWLKRGGRPPE